MSKHREPSEALKAFIRCRGSVKDETIVWYWEGNLYRHVPANQATPDYPPTGGFTTPNKPWVKIAGMSTNRTYYDEEINGWYWMGREVQWYLDPLTGAILDRFENKFIPRNVDGTGGVVTATVNVPATANDNINWIYAELEQFVDGTKPTISDPNDFTLYLSEGEWKVRLLGDLAFVGADLFFHMPSPLAGPNYKRFTGSDTSWSAECFHYHAKKAELFDPNSDKAMDITVAWTRLSEYLPWMHMGNAPGGTVILAHGYKVPQGFDGLPEWMKKELKEKYPMWLAPQQGKWDPNRRMQSSWTLFKQLLDSGRYLPTQIP